MKSLYRSWKLFLFSLKRERFMALSWVLGLSAFSIILAIGMGNLFDDASRKALVITLNNPGIISMMGPVYGADNYTIGAMYANTMFLWVAMAVAVMNIFLIVGLTRADEEEGRRELLSAYPVGRSAPLVSAFITAILVNMCLGIFHFAGFMAVNNKSMDLKGNLIYALSLVLFGLVFAGVTAVFSQLSSTARGAMVFSFGALGVFYMLRAAGDISNETLSLISPLGLMQRTKVFTSNEITPLLILLAEAIVLMILAELLNRRRDMGSGLLSERSGRKNASSALKSVSGLTGRLLRTPMIIWLFVIFIFAAAYGTVLGDLEDFVSKNPFYQKIIGTSTKYSFPMMFVSMVNSIMTFLAAIPVVSSVLGLNKEENSGRIDHVLSRPVSRTGYFIRFICFAFILSIILQLANAFGLYASASAVLEDKIELSFFLKSSLVYLPAVWIIASIAILLYGLYPKAVNGVWAFLGYSFWIIFLGRVIDLPEWVKNISPFNFIPRLPEDSITWSTLIIMTLIAVILTVTGVMAYRKRDLAG